MRTIGSTASSLLDYLDGSHHNGTQPERERRLRRTWIDAAATYAGTHAASGTRKLSENPKWLDYQAAAETIEWCCAKCYADDQRLPIQPRDEVRIVKKLGSLPKNLPQNAPIDVDATDESYGRSLWPSGMRGSKREKLIRTG